MKRTRSITKTNCPHIEHDCHGQRNGRVKAQQTIFMIAFTHVPVTNYALVIVVDIFCGSAIWLSFEWDFIRNCPTLYFWRGRAQKNGDFFGVQWLNSLVRDSWWMPRINEQGKCILFRWKMHFQVSTIHFGLFGVGFSSCTALRCDPTQNSERARSTISEWRSFVIFVVTGIVFCCCCCC